MGELKTEVIAKATGVFINDGYECVFLNHNMIEFTIQFIDEMMYVNANYFEIYDYLMISILETGAITLTDGSECVIINEDQISTLKDILENYIDPVNYKKGVVKSQIQKQLV